MGPMQGRADRPALRSVPWAARLAALCTGVLVAALLVAGVASARGGGPSAAAPARLPADFPSDISLPAGSLQGATGSAGQWSVLILAPGSAAAVERSTEKFYVAAGFRRVRFGVLARGTEQITIAAENRDHSATETNLALGVTDSKAAPTGPALVATILPGRARMSLAAARRSGLRVRFTAPAAARSVTVRAYREAGGRRHLLGSRVQSVHAATNTVALDSVAIRRRISVGLYTLQVVLHGAGSSAAPATTSIRVSR